MSHLLKILGLVLLEIEADTGTMTKMQVHIINCDVKVPPVADSQMYCLLLFFEMT